MSMQEKFTAEVENLFASNVCPVVSDFISIPASQNLKRGTLLTVEGKAVEKGGDVYAVLAEDVVTASSAKEAAVYLSGEFREDAVIVGTGTTVADVKTSARKVGIFLKAGI